MIATNRLVLLSRRCCRPSSNSLLTHVKHAPRKRLYSQGSATTPSIANKRSPGQHNPKHEVHEGTAALSVGFNPSGGGIGSGPGGSSSTNGSLMDTVLATLVGLGIGKHSGFFLGILLESLFQFSLVGSRIYSGTSGMY